MADAESISIEETNKIRIALGLKPLNPVLQTTEITDEAGNVVLTADDEERKAVENLRILRAEQARAAEEEALKLRLKKQESYHQHLCIVY
jgi:U4/U6.U5 tri-snRNP-associated protein 1